MASPQDFGAVVSRLWRFLKTASLFLIAVSAYVLVKETVVVGVAAFDVHPVLGVLFLAVVGTAVWAFVARPLVRYWRMPAAANPPELTTELDRAAVEDLAARSRFLHAVAVNLARNPRLATRSSETSAALADADLLLATAKASGSADAERWRADIRRFEATRLEPLFAPLDEEANRVIRGEALAVGLGTAVSMNGVLDAWIVLWRNLNLVSRVAEVYYGRPGIRGTLFVLRDVAAGILVASKAQGLADGAAGFFGGWLGKTGGAVMGPVVDGALNGAVTVRIGYVAKRRCRAFRKWTEQTATEAVRQCVLEAASHAKGVAMDVVKAAGGGLVNAAGDVAKKAADVVMSWFQREQPADPTLLGAR
ncbi:MAG TPA: YcjF family protein [Planctomycetota bacterium]|nr:YcjF family protein [Planctomycetota bacterium]